MAAAGDSWNVVDSDMSDDEEPRLRIVDEEGQDPDQRFSIQTLKALQRTFCLVLRRVGLNCTIAENTRSTFKRWTRFFGRKIEIFYCCAICKRRHSDANA
jgi:hypothetical protein